jgi:alpha-beta hydrolase superfamily lysophospholipase
VITRDVQIEVTVAAGTGEVLHVAATVFLPDERPERSPAFFGFPGGGYNRGYFNLDLPGGGYSQAEFHTSHGAIFVACDHLAVGDSSVPRSALSHADLARVNAYVVTQIAEMLRADTLSTGIRLGELAPLVGLGQSYGGLLLTVAQANHETFDAVGFLGWSGINTVVPVDQQLPGAEIILLQHGDGLDHPYVDAFHWSDVPRDVVREDMTGYPFRPSGQIPAWATPLMPGGPNVSLERPPLGPAVVEEAARINVPILIAVGERDVCPDPWLEPTAYRSSRDITLVQMSGMAHMHNFAGTRAALWRRISAWAAAVPRREPVGPD